MRWSRFFRRTQWDQERERELQAYLELETEENIARGLPPLRAHEAARRKLGNRTLIREEIYRMNSISFVESLFQDIRYSLRTLAKSPAFTLIVVASPALGIGANTAIFSLIDAALLKMLPVTNPEQLVQFNSISPALEVNDAFPYPAFEEFRDLNQVFSGVLAFRTFPDIDFEVNGQGGLVNGQVVSGNYFTVLGVKAVLGRTIRPEDEKTAGQSPVAVINFDYWRKRFALDPGVIGKKIVLNNSPFTIIGVTPAEFFGLQPGQQIDVSIPITTTELITGFAAAGTRYNVLTAPFRNWLHVIGRLKPSVTSQKAVANLEPIFRRSAREGADSLAGLPFDSPSARKSFLSIKPQLNPGGKGLAALRKQFSKPLSIIMAIVALLLLVTCANVANLLLARANARQKEIAIRLTVGAGRQRLIRQLITESSLLALAGGALGLFLAFWASSSLVFLISHSRSAISLQVLPDASVLGFTLLVSLLTAFLFGTIPAWRSARSDLTPTLIQNTRSSSNAGGRSRLGKMLVVLQVAISLVLMIGAGLLTRSLENLKDFSPGFNKENVLLLSVNPGMVGYNEAQLVPLYERLLDRFKAIPGIRQTSLSIYSPLGRGFGSTEPKVQGYTPQPGKELTPVGINVVGPEYFTTLETPLLLGRDFTFADRAGARRVAIINETMTHYYFGNANPIGRRFSVAGWQGDPSWMEIIGVVKDAKNHDLREQPAPMAYMPLFQSPESGVTFEIRTAINPASATTAVLQAVKEIDGRLPVFDVKTLNDQLDDSLVEERLVASLSSLFGVLALVLACVGLYGLMTYAVNLRTNEIGIRMALGAEHRQISRMVLREVLLLVLLGLAIGVPLALMASRLIASELFGLEPTDPITVVAASLVLIAVAAVAGYLPARRAARVDPMIALRYG